MRVRQWDRLGNGGISFTELGFGAAPLGNLYRAISEHDAQDILVRAWAGGVRYFDTAPLYGYDPARRLARRNPGPAPTPAPGQTAAPVSDKFLIGVEPSAWPRAGRKRKFCAR